MRLLLDTHAFLWYITANDRLSPDAANAITEGSNEVYLSVVSIWEALVKYQLGKLSLPSPAKEYLLRRQDQHGILSLPLDPPPRAFWSCRHITAIHLIGCWYVRRCIMT